MIQWLNGLTEDDPGVVMARGVKLGLLTFEMATGVG